MARRHAVRRYRSFVFLGAFFAARCGGPTTPTPPPVNPAPVIACPAAQTAQSLGGATVVSYPSPVASDGTQPLAVSCVPASGSAFDVGVSKVNCTVTDALQRSASCTFNVTVVPPVSRLSATRFVAFGDSITEGKFADGSVSSSPFPLTLQTALRSRYPSQTPIVVNRGLGGETAVGGVARLSGVLAADAPEAVLLLEGVNDLATGASSAVQPMLDALRSMMRQVRGRGAMVLLATLLPERPGPGTPATRNGALPLISQANDQIRRMAGEEGAVLVDLFKELGGTPDPWIGSDNLHPTDTGYQKIADLWLDAIRLQFESSPTLTLTAGSSLTAGPVSGPAARRGWR